MSDDPWRRPQLELPCKCNEDFFFFKVTAEASLKCHQNPIELITFKSECKEPLCEAPHHGEDLDLNFKKVLTAL